MSDALTRLKTALASRYTLERELGAGGMATVYLAHDLKHDRKVAIKVLKPELAAVLGAERFVQEIKTTAGLQHPHILALHDSGEAGGFLYYVMPYIEGETLRDKLNRETQLGIEEAVRITTEVADALDYAHRNNVIHRDIKPENILLHDGRPMVADFGIALAVSAAAGGRMTETGLSLGTPHYMSPEQATAEKDLTNRSDIYSLGAVLYEMLTGSPPHVGSSAQQIIMKIVTEEAVPVTKTRKAVPPNVAAAVAKALEKLPADRFASARDLAAALVDSAFRHTNTRAAAPASDRRWRTAALVLGAWALAATGAIMLRWDPRPAETPDPVVISVVGTLDPRPVGQSLAISPDGRTIVFTKRSGSVSQLFMRRLDAIDAVPIAGTEGGHMPVFSPDGEWLAFIVGTGLKKVRLNGGTVSIILEPGPVAPNGGATWGPDGAVYFPYMAEALRSDTSRTSLGLARVPASGGDLEILTIPRGAEEHTTPHFLPDGRRLLFSVLTGTNALAVLDLATREWSIVSEEDIRFPHFVAPDQLIFARATGTLMAASFDPVLAQLTGEPTALGPIAESPTLVNQQFAASRVQSLVYAPDSGSSLLMVHVDGRQFTVTQDRRNFWHPRFSPDGRRVAVAVTTATSNDLWIYDLAQGTTHELTRGENALTPVWSSDGTRIAYAVPNKGVVWRYADGSGTPSALVESSGFTQVIDWSPDGRWLAYREWSDRFNIWRVDVETKQVERLFEEASAFRDDLSFSPDGSLVAYTTDELGRRQQIVVRSLEDPRNIVRVSITSGHLPRWTADGSGLYFVESYSEDAPRLLYASIDRRRELHAGEPREVMRLPRGFSAAYPLDFDSLTERFVMVKPATRHDVVLVQNWRGLLPDATRP